MPHRFHALPPPHHDHDQTYPETYAVARNTVDYTLDLELRPAVYPRTT